MSLIVAGYWPTTYFPENYWMQDYWPEYGTAIPARRPKSKDDMTQLYQQWLIINQYEPRISVQ